MELTSEVISGEVYAWKLRIGPYKLHMLSLGDINYVRLPIQDGIGSEKL